MQGQPRQKISKTQSQKQAVWWCTSVIPAMQEAKVGGSLSSASLEKSMRPYLKAKTKSKRAWAWLKWYSTCLESSRP
jgi:hypothetical protein